jgi:hypothetical protein
MTSTRRTTNLWRKRWKTTEGGKISHAQHSKTGYTTKSNLHVQYNSHQNPNDIHHRDWKIYPKVHLETQKMVNSQGNDKWKRAALELSQYMTSNYATEP